MIADVIITIDDNPLAFRLPFLPYTVSTYRLPLYVNYDPQATGWPLYAYYFTERMTQTGSLLIAGLHYAFTENHIPNPRQYTIHYEQNAAFIVVGIEIETLAMWRRYPVMGMTGIDVSQFGTRDDYGNIRPPTITQMPDIQKKADALKVSRFTFETISLNFIKENQSIHLYGGQMIVNIELKNEATNKIKEFFVGRYILNKINHDMNIAKISGIDFRYLLNIKYPTDTFSRVDFPFLEDEYHDKIKPECIGIGNGVPGIPLNGLQIYTSDWSSMLDWIEFQFPPGWTELYKIEYQDGDDWVEIWPGLGNPQVHLPNFGIPIYQEEHPHATRPRFGENQGNAEGNTNWQDSDSGRVFIWWSQARQNGARDQCPNRIRMYAKWPNDTMSNAFYHLLSLSRNPYLLQGFDGEFSLSLAPIGLYMNESKPIFEWIEQLQSANIIGGQLITKDNALYFRLENPNRGKKLDIPSSDVLNHETLGVQIAEDFMYSGWDISYVKSHMNNEIGNVIGVNSRYPTAAILNGHDATARFVYTSPRQQHFDTNFLRIRTAIIRDLIATFRHRIIGLEIPMYFDYMDLMIYDVIGYTPKVLEGSRIQFEWMIYEKRLNMRDETIVLTLVERVRSNNWRNGQE